MIYVTIYWNTEADGAPVSDDQSPEDWPRSHYGPFTSLAAAEHWMTEDYPDGDTDVAEIFAHECDPYPDGYVNHPDVIKATYNPGACLGVWTQGNQAPNDIP